MKNFIFIILGLTLIHFLHVPSDLERREAQRQRVLQLEKELLVRNLLLVRQDIDNKLTELKAFNDIDDQSRRELVQLKIDLENENKMIRNSMLRESTHDSWKVLKHRSATVLADTKKAFNRLVKRMENPTATKQTVLLYSRKKINTIH